MKLGVKFSRLIKYINKKRNKDIIILIVNTNLMLNIN